MSVTAPPAHLIYMSDVTPERLVWLSRGRLAAGKLTLLDGDPGLGKSTMLADWSARITRGEPLPEGDGGTPRGVVLLSAEDGLADTIRPRLEAAGADLARVAALVAVPDPAAPPGDPGRLPAIPADLADIEKAIHDADAALLIVDPLMAYLGGGTDAHRDQDIRRALAPLTQLAERTGVAVVLVRHLNKAQSSHALYRGGGSIGIIGAARCGLLVAADPDDPERRVLAPIKSNLARPPAALAFRLVAAPGTDVARVEWLGETGHTAAALLAVPDDEARSEGDDAAAWLAAYLGDGPVEAKDAFADARKAGHAERTVKRAKKVLNVQTTREGFGPNGRYRWALPNSNDDADPPPIGGHDPHRGPTKNDGPLWGAVAPYGAGGGANGTPPTPRPAGTGHGRCFACGGERPVGGVPCPTCHPPAIPGANP